VDPGNRYPRTALYRRTPCAEAGMTSAIVLIATIGLLSLSLGSGHLASHLAALHRTGPTVAVAAR